MKSTAKTALMAGLVVILLLYLAKKFPTLVGGIDFPDFYCAGLMAREHVDLYDPLKQQDCQAREAGRHGTYYIHPPFEALLFAPLTSLSLKYAYLLWNLLGCILLSASFYILCRMTPWAVGWELSFVLSFLYPPLLLNFVQGQDSVLLLCVIVLTFYFWQKRHFGWAGAVLGLGLFKFHIVLSMALLLTLRGRWRFLAGFSLSTLAVTGITTQVFGWKIWPTYVSFLRELPSLPMSGVHWRAMANVRGTISLLMPEHSPLAQGLIFVISIALLLIGFQLWLRTPSSRQSSLAFAATIIISLLVGYHLNPHDLVLLVLPIVVILSASPPHTTINRWTLIVVIGLYLPPLHLLALSAELYVLLSLLLIGLLSVNAILLRGNDLRAETPGTPARR